MKASIQVVLWDAGGTLVRTRRKVGEYYSEVGKSFGYTLDPEESHRRFKKAFVSLKPRPEASIPQNGDDRGWWKELVQLCTPEHQGDSKFHHFFETLYTGFENPEWWELFSDVLPALDFFKARGLRQAVLSNWDSRLNPILTGMKIDAYFERRWISAEQGFEKPNPLFYQKVFEGMGVRPEECLVIGDDPINDDEAPKALGCQTFLVQRPERGLDRIFEYFG
ncbi:MAG: HAD-IA family hydrolase [Verrucomicrobiota bacterium]